MAGRSRLVASAAASVGLMVLGTPGASDAQGRRPAAQAVERQASVSATSPGRLEGVVKDEKGAPVAGAMVSALGAANVFAVTDLDGRFAFPTLPPGPYLVRAHGSGFGAPRPQTIEVRASARSVSSIALRRSTAPPAILAAGFGGETPEQREVPVIPAVSALDLPEPADTLDRGSESETAWRVRHARRGVLKNAGAGVSGVDAAGHSRSDESYSARSTSLFANVPFSGQVNFLTTGLFERPEQLLAPSGLASGVAYIRVGAPVGDNADWTVRGALTEADISSWIVAGSYLTRETPHTREAGSHRYDIGLSYSTQRYDGGNPLALRDVADGTRNAGEVYGFDTYALSSAVTFAYGARYARYDYLERRNLVSPRLEVTATPWSDTRVSALVSRRALAPGAEEFLPPGDTGIWLPPQRTFSAIEPGQPLDAERATHVALALEHDIASSTITFRGFRQQVDNQLVTAFGVDLPGVPNAQVGHYVVGSAGDAQVTGGTVAFRTSTLGNRVNGAVAYSLSNAQLTPDAGLRYVVLLAPSKLGFENERIHDLSTTISADVPETATRVLVVYRASNGFVRPGGGAGVEPKRSAFDSRFDVQVRQSLPFMNFSSARWEALVAVRNFFREAATEQSVYDELLVVQPPKRLVGGVTLHF